MNWKTNFVLAAILASLLAVWLFRPFQSATGEREAGPRNTVLARLFDPPIVPNDITRVTITRRDDEPMQFERAPGLPSSDVDGNEVGAWEMTQPVRVPIDATRVDQLIARVATLTTIGDALPVNPTDAELDPPRGSITLEAADGTRYAVDIGGVYPLSNDTYVRKPGSAEIFVAESDWRAEVDRAASAYRDRIILRLDRNRVARALLTRQTETTELVRDQSVGGWRMIAPFETPANPSTVSVFLAQFAQVQVLSFTEPQSESLTGFDRPFLTATFELAPFGTLPAQIDPEVVDPDARIELIVGNPVDLNASGRYARLANEPWVFVLDSRIIENLIPDPTEIRDARMLPAGVDNLQQIRFIEPQRTITLTRQADRTWRGTSPVEVVDRDQLNEFTAALRRLVASGFLDQPGARDGRGFDPPRMTLELSFQPIGIAYSDSPPPPRTVTLRFGDTSSTARSTFITRDDEPTVFICTSVLIDRLLTNPLALRARDIFDFDPQRMTSLRIQRDGRDIRASRTAGGWTTDPQQVALPIQPRALEIIATDLGALRASAILDAADPADADDPFGFASPVAVLEFELTPLNRDESATASATPRFRLTLAQSRDSYFARRDDLPFVFQLEPTAFRSLTAEVIDFALDLAPEAGAIEEITLRDARDLGVALTYQRTADTWTAPAETQAQADPEQAETLAGVIANLRAAKWITLSDPQRVQVVRDDAVALLAIRTRAGHVATLAFAESSNDVAWLERGTVFELSAPQRAALLTPLRDVQTEQQPSGD